MSKSESRVIVITGATRGLGRALVDGFVSQGHTVLGCGRSARHVEELRSAYPAPHDFAVVDVTNPQQVQKWADRVLASHSAPDLLIANAAVINRPAPLWKIPAEEFDPLVDINIKGVANVVRSFVPAMVERGRGVIVNLSSAWGRSTSPEVAPYCASKYAVEGLTLSLAQELPKGMAAVPLNPGVIDTDMLRIAFGEQAGNYPGAREWASRAVPFLLELGPKDNGRSLSVS